VLFFCASRHFFLQLRDPATQAFRISDIITSEIEMIFMYYASSSTTISHLRSLYFENVVQQWRADRSPVFCYHFQCSGYRKLQVYAGKCVKVMMKANFEDQSRLLENFYTRTSTRLRR
jgi:hypothetical protein